MVGYLMANPVHTYIRYIRFVNISQNEIVSSIAMYR